MAARLRGGLAKLREEFGDDAVMIVPIQQASRAGMVNALNSHPEPEEVSSPTTLSDGEEE